MRIQAVAHGAFRSLRSGLPLSPGDDAWFRQRQEICRGASESRRSDSRARRRRRPEDACVSPAFDARFRLSASQRRQVVSMTAAASRTARLPDTERPQIVFSDVTLNLGGKAIVENISLDVKPGEFLCIIGASGCGKTTALRLAARVYQPTSGTVTFDGKPMLVPRRDIAIVFQDYGKALLPWRTAAGNVSLALEATGVAPGARDARIKALLEKVGLAN